MSQSGSQDPEMLFAPYRLNGLVLPNRMVMAPITGSRAHRPGEAPTELDALYYSQRASAGLIVTEATQISPEGKGDARTLGIYTKAQRDGWRLVTDAVHDAGGRIFLQLWHAGRVSHSSLQSDGRAPVAPSAIRARDTNVCVIDADDLPKMVPADTPRALETTEIARVVDDFRRAGDLAMQAGFDGVEIHGGKWLSDRSVLPEYDEPAHRSLCGSVENRVRFLSEVTRAVAAEVGANRTGVSLAPYIICRDMADPEIIGTILEAAHVLEEQEIAYMHLSETEGDNAPVVPDSFRESIRKHYTNTIIVAGRYDYARAAKILEAGHADLVAFDAQQVGR